MHIYNSNFLRALTLAGFFAGCAAPKPDPPQTPQTVTPPAKSAEQILKENALSLRQGMNEAQITRLLCKPETTSIETLGYQTPRPWSALVWRYQKGYVMDKLVIYFQKTNDGWLVNSWRWGF
jgi:hypothetical protein